METYSLCNPFFFFNRMKLVQNILLSICFLPNLLDHLDIFRADGLLEATCTCKFIPCVFELIYCQQLRQCIQSKLISEL